MLTVNAVSDLAHITPARVRQLLQELDLSYYRNGSSNKGKIILPSESVASILKQQNFYFESISSVIGQVKGGIGKSVLTFNTACSSAERGARVLVIDCDPDCTMTNYLRPDDLEDHQFGTLYEVATQEGIVIKDVILKSKVDGIDFVAAKPKLRKIDKHLEDFNLATFISEKIESARESYDVILLDVPANFSNLAAAAYLYADIVIMPVIPDINAIEDCSSTMEFVREQAEIFKDSKLPEYKILRNKFKKENLKGKQKAVATRDAEEELKREYGEYLLDIRIPDRTDVLNAVNEGISIFAMDKANRDIKDSLESLAKYICPMVKRENNKVH